MKTVNIEKTSPSKVTIIESPSILLISESLMSLKWTHGMHFGDSYEYDVENCLTRGCLLFKLILLHSMHKNPFFFDKEAAAI